MSSTAASSPTRGPTTTRGLEHANLPSSRSRSSALSFPPGSGGIRCKYRRGVGRGQGEGREPREPGEARGNRRPEAYLPATTSARPYDSNPRPRGYTIKPRLREAILTNGG